MEIDKKSPDCRTFLTTMMNLLEEAKKQHKDLEAIQNEIVGQAHLENYALKLFLYADNEDRAGRFGKNVVKSFYTAGMLMDVLTTFGDVSEDLEKNRKYAKWKAAYIHNCLKNGETPISGPLPEDNDMSELGAEFGATDIGGGGGFNPGAGPMDFGPSSNLLPSTSAPRGVSPVGGYSGQPGYGQPAAPGFGQFPNSNSHHPVAAPRGGPAYGQPPSTGFSQPAPTSYVQPVVPATSPPQPSGAVGGGNVVLKAEDYTRAMKLCKFATSALQYEDSKTAIENLTKALSLLTTGRE
jgi:vacuolar protein sorting-associated protein VTA1